MSEEGYESRASMSFSQILLYISYNISYPSPIYALGSSCSDGGMISQHHNMVTAIVNSKNGI